MKWHIWRLRWKIIPVESAQKSVNTASYTELSRLIQKVKVTHIHIHSIIHSAKVCIFPEGRSSLSYSTIYITETKKKIRRASYQLGGLQLLIRLKLFKLSSLTNLFTSLALGKAFRFCQNVGFLMSFTPKESIKIFLLLPPFDLIFCLQFFVI